MKSIAKSIYKHLFVLYNILTEGGENMKLTLRYNITKIDKKQKEIIEEIMWHATKVYNMVLYELREGKRKIDVNKSIKIIQTEIYKEERKNNWHSKYMHSHTLQQVIVNVIQNYKSYIKAKEDYEKRKNKYRGKPKEPRYKQGKKQEIVFTKYAIRKEKNRIKLSISKEIQEKFKSRSINFLISRRLKKLINFESIKMIKIVKKEEELEMEIIYERKEKEERKGTNIMSIDIGINNIVACTNKENSKSMLVSGREAKSKNKYIQEKIRKLQQINKKAKENREKEKVKNTKRIEKMWKYRKNYMNTYMHKVSKMVIEYAKENKCVEIVIGDLKRIKEGMKGNKSFVQMPLKELVRKIEYKAKLEGIKVNKIGEEYTSGVSAIDKEEIKKENYNKKRRISRGIYISKEGKKINADINGSLNILRKYIKKSSPNQEIAMDNGREQRPLKKRVA